MTTCLSHMRPPSSIRDAAHVAPLKPKGVSNALVYFSGCGPSTHLSNNIVGQRGIVVLFALMSAVVSHVLHVAGSRIPSKVSQMVIAGVAIVVARLKSRRAWTNKSIQHKVVDVASIATPKSDDKPAIVGAVRTSPPRLQAPPCFAGAPSVVSAGPNGPICPDSIARMVFDVSICDCHFSVISQNAELA